MARKRSATSSPGYDDYRESQAAISRERSAAGREIGPIPGVADPARRATGLASLRDFCLTYFAFRFPLPFARCHDEAIERLQACTDSGGLLACAMPRGSGKTTLAECAVLRAVLYGLRRFVVLVQATQPLAASSLAKLQRELETNDLLLADFPEVCYPVRRLERIHNRARGQTLDGEPTRISWTSDGVTLPTVPGAPASGAILRVSGLTGAVRGLSAAGPSGEIMRPDMVLVDDAQTRESARSPTQTAEREAIVADDLLALAGPTVTISAVMLCTVIYPGDLSDRHLDREKHPEWQGVRTKMLTAWPARMDLWDQYAEVRRESWRSGDEGRRATEFYREHQAEMDAGAEVSWPERKKAGELSGLQSAMNLWLTNPRGFLAEYQNEPEPDGGPVTAKELDPDQVAARLSGLPRFEVPRESSRLTAFIDVGGGLHWYAVIAWDNACNGAVVDYGCWPRQARAMFAASDAKPSLADRHPGLSETAVVYAGLVDLVGEILGRAYRREAVGGEVKVERCLIDSGWCTQTVYQFCRATPFASVIYPSKGIGRTATARGVSEWKPRPGERSGWHWRLTTSETGRGKMVQFDPDAWKTFCHERLTTAMGGRGCLTLFGRAASAHSLIGEHCAAEQAEAATLRGQTFDKWSQLPHKPDNHLFDCLVGCAVAASVEGLTWSAAIAAGQPEAQEKPRERVRLSDLQKAKREGRR